jgi:hypothetical protein
MITADQIQFCEHYQQHGNRVDAVREAFPEYAGKPQVEAVVFARELLASHDVQEYLGFLAQEGRGRAALPLSEFLFNMDSMKVGSLDNMQAALRNREFQAAAAFARIAFQCEESRGKASGLFDDRSKENNRPGTQEDPLNVNVRWAA